MGDLIMEIIIYLLALGIAIIPFFVKKITTKWKRIIVVIVFILVVFGMSKAISGYEKENNRDKKFKTTQETLEKLVTSDSTLNDSYRQIKEDYAQLNNNYANINSALRNSNLIYDSLSKTITNTSNFYGSVKNANTAPNYGTLQMAENIYNSERSFTRSDGTKLLKEIKIIRDKNNLSKCYLIGIPPGATAGRFISEMKIFLEKNGFPFAGSGSVPDMQIKGFKVDPAEDGCFLIYVGYL